MTFNRPGKHVVDVMFIIALFTVFTASALFVVIIGAKTYKTTVENMSDNYDQRTSVHYVASKIRQFDSAGGIELGEIGGVQALVFKQQAGGSTYLTYLYHYKGMLHELTINSKITAEPGFGQAIASLKGFSAEARENGLLKLVMTQEDGTDETLFIRPHCAEN